MIIGGGTPCPGCGLTAGHGSNCAIGKAEQALRVLRECHSALVAVERYALRVTSYTDNAFVKENARGIVDTAKGAREAIEKAGG